MPKMFNSTYSSIPRLHAKNPLHLKPKPKLPNLSSNPNIRYIPLNPHIITSIS